MTLDRAARGRGLSITEAKELAAEIYRLRGIEEQMEAAQREREEMFQAYRRELDLAVGLRKAVDGYLSQLDDAGWASEQPLYEALYGSNPASVPPVIEGQMPAHTIPIQPCDGSTSCEAETHIHGCFAEESS